MIKTTSTTVGLNDNMESLPVCSSCCFYIDLMNLKYVVQLRSAYIVYTELVNRKGEV